MSVPSTFADLSTTPASNSGLISDASAVNVIDDHLRAIYAFIASIYANSGNGWSSSYLTALNPSYTGSLAGGTGVVNLGSGQFYKDNSGRVGIGTASPTTRLVIENTAAADGVLIRSTSFDLNLSTTSNGLVLGANYNTGIGYVVAGGSSTTTALVFATANTAAPSERMRIDSAGNVGIGATAHPSAVLDVQSTSKGLRLPNMTTAEKNAISSPAAGLMVFDSSLGKACLYTGSAWQTITSA